MKNDINFDWINDAPADLARKGIICNGNSNDYGDEVLPSTKPKTCTGKSTA